MENVSCYCHLPPFCIYGNQWQQKLFHSDQTMKQQVDEIMKLYVLHVDSSRYVYFYSNEAIHQRTVLDDNYSITG